MGLRLIVGYALASPFYRELNRAAILGKAHSPFLHLRWARPPQASTVWLCYFVLLMNLRYVLSNGEAFSPK